MVLPRELLAFNPEPVRRTYSPTDIILYHLGIGAGEKGAESDLCHVWEDQLVVLPPLASVLASNLQWLRRPEFGIAIDQMVHAEQEVTWFAPIPPGGEAEVRTRVEALYDRGPERGALLRLRSDLSCDGILTACSAMTLLLRGDGGFGGSPPPKAQHDIPVRRPDFSVSSPTRPEQAMIYRLSGDLYPLHIDPAFARRAGFESPILHGLATYGYAARHAIAALCGGDCDRLRQLSARFSAPVYPGEEIATEFWRVDQSHYAFRSLAGGKVVLAGGRAEIS